MRLSRSTRNDEEPTSSITGGERAPTQASGRDTDSLGPSDSSDSGSDVQGERINATEPDDGSTWGAVPVERHSDSDASGTGERASALPGSHSDAPDIRPDHIERIGGDVLDEDQVSLDDPEALEVDDLAVEDDDEEAEDTDGEGAEPQ